MATKSEIIASRKTFDGKTVELWSDGAVTVGSGMTVRFVKGAGVAKTEAARAANVRAGFAVLGNAAVLTVDELPKAVAAARRAEAAGKSAAEVSQAA